MPKVEIFLSIILLTSGVVNSYAIENESLTNFENTNYIIFNSGIVQIDEHFFLENNFKRYLIFGTNEQENNLIKQNSIHEINSDNGFFHVTLLSEKNTSNLISKGYNVIEDFKLDFHSTKQFSDASRISQISKSDIAEKNMVILEMELL